MLESVGLIIKLLLYVSGLLCIGLALHACLKIMQLKRALRLCALVFLTMFTFRLLHLNAQLGGSFTSAFSQDTMGWVWSNHSSQTYVFIAAIGLIFAGSFTQTLYAQRALLLSGAFAISVGFGLAGHSHSLSEPGLAPFLVMGHVLIAGFWLVAPITLWPRASIPSNDIESQMRIFSSWATWIIPLFFASGIWLLWRIGGDLNEIVGQTYGRLLLVKLLVATVILGIGAYNKISVTTYLALNPDEGRILLKKMLLADAVLFLLALFLIAAATTLFGPH